MKQLLILSGKGGTGKTTVASAFIDISNAMAYADCDVDAPNLHLVMQKSRESIKKDYYGMPKAYINPTTCIECDYCYDNCRFDAIVKIPEKKLVVDNFSCEGCGVCEKICPTNAITMEPSITGQLELYLNPSVFSTAKLKMGSGNSGKLVTEVKNQLKSAAKGQNFAIIDGSPGIGCPVIASLSGIDLVLIVAEPTVSGISDMGRIMRTAKQFQVKTAVCINKYDINPQYTKEIENFCQTSGIPFVGVIPYDTQAVESINAGKTIVSTNCPSGIAVGSVFKNTMPLLFE